MSLRTHQFIDTVDYFREVKQTKRKDDQSRLITVEFNTWSSTSTSPYTFMVLCLRVRNTVLSDVMSGANEM
jgi:hypothetical protein